MRTISTLALTIASLAAIAAPAQANPTNQTDFAIDVESRDLDLATEKGISRLDDRLQTRIRQMCRTGGRDRASIELERACREGAYASSRRDVRLAVMQAKADRVRLAQNTAAKAAETPGA